MRHNIYISVKFLFVAVLSLLAVACSKERLGDENNLPYITFGVAGADASLNTDTKALITNGSFTSSPVYVYGVKNNTEAIFNGTTITKDNNSSNWKTAQQLQWVARSSYSFYGYTVSPANPQGFSVTNSGLKISVSQPENYSEADMVDYMLSHTYKVADGSNYHIVMLYMQHAMAWVEIVVKKQMEDHYITLNNITLSNIFRQATMQCESQAIANNGEDNVWLTTLSGANDLSYTKTSFEVSDVTLGTMSLLAVPQHLYRETVLSVEYTVDENGPSADGGTTTYTESFQLFNYVPFVWESGHKITYTLTINTGVELKADISDWKDAGYTEGIILPD